METLYGLKGSGVEFEYAKRDISYLTLGKKTGDCTADKAPFQADRDIENIFWTVFPWILDRNYQILKVFYNGSFVMKVHMLPLFILNDSDGEMVLAVDAIETVREFRDDINGYGKSDLLAQKNLIFEKVLMKIIDISSKMGIGQIYGEKFSNTKWVRDLLSEKDEIFFNVNNLIKLDELEDVFSLSEDLSEKMHHETVDSVFMELQMKNTFLTPKITSKTSDLKSYAIIKGDSERGIPMKNVIGV